MKKRLIAIILCMQLLLVGMLTGCAGSGLSVEEGKSTIVMTIEDQNVTLSEVNLYMIQYAYNNTLKADAVDEASETEIIDKAMDEVKLATVEYLLAQTMGAEITEEDIATAKASAQGFYEYFGADYLGQFGIDQACVEDLFVKQAYVTAMRNKTVADLSEDYLAQFEEDYAELTFHSMYYALFPSVQYDADGNVVKDAEGNPMPLSEEELAAQLTKAEELQGRAAAGESMEDLVAEYGIGYCSTIQRGYYGEYSAELNAVVEGLENGDISDVVKTDAGYMVVRMDNTNDTEYKEYMISYAAKQNANQLLPTMQENWMTQSGVGSLEPDATAVEKIDLIAICEGLDKYDLYMKEQ